VRRITCRSSWFLEEVASPFAAELWSSDSISDTSWSGASTRGMPGGLTIDPDDRSMRSEKEQF
jgi:hypothetical protein